MLFPSGNLMQKLGKYQVLFFSPTPNPDFPNPGICETGKIGIKEIGNNLEKFGSWIKNELMYVSPLATSFATWLLMLHYVVVKNSLINGNVCRYMSHKQTFAMLKRHNL